MPSHVYSERLFCIGSFVINDYHLAWSLYGTVVIIKHYTTNIFEPGIIDAVGEQIKSVCKVVVG